jgi:hypothetical protein
MPNLFCDKKTDSSRKNNYGKKIVMMAAVTMP